MTRTRLSFLSLLCLLACDTETADAGSSSVIEPGWQLRKDEDVSSESPAIRFTASDGGFVAKNGPNVILWRPEHTVRSGYSLGVDMHHIDTYLHPHGAGLFFGGSDLEAPTQKYTYFLIRGDGYYLIKVRDGSETKDVTPWTKHDSIRAVVGKAVAKNAMRVEVGDANVRFFVNDVEIQSVPKDKLHTDGIYGFRQVHDLEVRYAQLRCEPRAR